MPSFTTFPLKLRNRHFFAVDVLLLSLTPMVALALRTDGMEDMAMYFPSLLVATATFLVIKLAVYFQGGLYTRYWRYASVDELANITILGVLALLAQTLVFFLVLKPNGWVAAEFPRSMPVIDGILSLIAVGGVRYSVRLAERHRPHSSRPDSSNGKSSRRVVVAGAGWAGVSIVKEMLQNPQIEMNPVAFVDDDPNKQGMLIRNVPVLGKCSDITRVAAETGALQVVIAMPTAQGDDIRSIVHACEEAGLQVKIVPGMYELLGGTVGVKQLRDVKIEDLLRREPIRIDTVAIDRLLRGKRVLVTGAGGSIGSELCRQVLRFEPENLVMLGHGENSIFEIYGELTRLQPKAPSGDKTDGNGNDSGNGNGNDSGKSNGSSRGPRTRLYSAIADIRSVSRLRAVFETYRPEVVFHAAAHKHVHLMEMNPTEAVTNNVLGTRNVLEASLAVGVAQFVMISTDKAVNPVGVMGASKRIAELLVHQAAAESGRAYVAVRFGNVLGSRGSAVLTFQQQIAAGGPVTITHPDMRRFFMTIPEAVQLVLQAATLGSGGEVFMLDMGEPVKIVDLARDLIELSGLQVGKDIEITYTGLRPGEKLYEEMFLLGEDYKRTQHEKIFISDNASSFVPENIGGAIHRLEEASERNDEASVLTGLSELVSEFQPVETMTVGIATSGPAQPGILNSPDPAPSFHRGPSR